mmetsp:Transcript_28327/g.72566  ORF Transcript_28327/g.72566 Transcript_28327/m.72566 type:complete len:300 (+) Transcript_28327:280-1179(+)
MAPRRHAATARATHVRLLTPCVCSGCAHLALALGMLFARRSTCLLLLDGGDLCRGRTAAGLCGLLLLGEVELHKRREEDEKHLGLAVGDVFPEHEDHAPCLARAGDGKARVELALLGRDARGQLREIDRAGRDRLDQLENVHAGGNRAIAELLQGRHGGADAAVGPFDDVLLLQRLVGDRGEELDHVVAHQLPRQCEHELHDAVLQVLALDADEREAECRLAELHGIVAVDDLRVDVLGLLGDLGPVDDPRLDRIHQLQQQQPVAHLRRQVRDVRVDAEGVDPHAERALLAGVALVLRW